MFSSTYACVRSFVRSHHSPEPSLRSTVTSSRRSCIYAATASRSWSISIAVVSHDGVAVGNRHLVDVEVGAGRCRLAHDSTPVRVLAVPRALAQVAFRDTPRRVGCIVVAGRANDPDPHDLRRAFGVHGHLFRKIATDPRERSPITVASSVAPAPALPLARAITVSFVDVQPSTVRRWKECSIARASCCCKASGVITASVVTTASIVAMFGLSIAAPFAIPPTVTPSADRDRLFPQRVGGHDRFGGRLGRFGALCQRFTTAGTPVMNASSGKGNADETGRTDQNVLGCASERRGDEITRTLGGRPPVSAGRGVRVARVQTRPQPHVRP